MSEDSSIDEKGVRVICVKLHVEKVSVVGIRVIRWIDTFDIWGRLTLDNFS